MSTMHLRPRQPLVPLSIPHLPPPSPVSLPAKRSAECSRGNGKIRKVSIKNEDGGESIKKARGGSVTPTLKRFYEKDELGVGKSPARRLFVDEEKGCKYGIIGATVSPTTSHPTRSLAPSPPIESRSSPAPITPIDEPSSPIPSLLDLENGKNIHHPGFDIYNDDLPSYFLPPTPDSKRTKHNPANLAPDAEIHIPSSPCTNGSETGMEDQENIPPTPCSSVFFSPKKIYWDETPAGSGSGRRRKMERSKLGLGVVNHSLDDLDAEEMGEELTPGRVTLDKGASRRAFMREVGRI